MIKLLDIIAAYGTPTDLARELGLAPQVVFNWRLRKSVPGKHIMALVSAGQRKGVNATAEDFLHG